MLAVCKNGYLNTERTLPLRYSLDGKVLLLLQVKCLTAVAFTCAAYLCGIRLLYTIYEKIRGITAVIISPANRLFVMKGGTQITERHKSGCGQSGYVALQTALH